LGAVKDQNNKGIGGMKLEFCSCGSLRVNSTCTNRKCSHHDSSRAPATFDQVEYIKDLLEKSGDQREIDFQTLTKKQASKIIDELAEEVD
jgi:hypothetical protein